VGPKVSINASEQCFLNCCTHTAGGKRTVTCFVLRWWYVYKFCTVTAVSVHALYCDSGTCTLFCIVTAVGVHVLYCASGTCAWFVLC
jgi:hypothetical protein